MSNLFRTKSLDTLNAEAGGDNHLNRTLTPLHIIAMGVGTVVGAGIFVITGTAAANYAGPALVISFVLAAIACCFTGLCYSEFSSMIPVAGSAYTYAYAALGEIAAWFVGWAVTMEYLVTGATISAGWGGYALSLVQDLGLNILPARLVHCFGTDLVYYNGLWNEPSQIMTALNKAGIDPATLPHDTAIMHLPAALILFLLTFVAAKGIKESAGLNNLVVLLKLGVIGVFLVVGGYFISNHWQLALNNWTPFIPANTGTFGEFGWSGILRGASVVFFAFIGFDAVSTLAQESKNPSRDMPLGILGSLFVCTILYIAVTLVLTGIVNYTELNVNDPVAVGINATGVSWGKLLVKLGTVIGLLSGMLMVIVAQARVFLTMSHDGLLPAWLGEIHPKTLTPLRATLVVGAVNIIMVTLLPIEVLGELVSAGTIVAFIAVSLGIIAMRKHHPEAKRTFRVPLVPLIPILGAVLPLILLLCLNITTWIIFAIWMSIGIAIYYFYGRKHSRLQLSYAEPHSEEKPQAEAKPQGEAY